MPNDKTMALEWHYTTPCGSCGTIIRVAKDPSCGKSPYSNFHRSVRATCKSCGHEEEYPASAVDNKLL